MLNSIEIIFENCDNAYKSKNSKKNIKKYIKKLLEYLDEDKYLDTLNNHKNNISKYFNINLQINFKLKDNNLNIFARKLSERDINKIKLKNKLNSINNKQNYLEEKKK